LMNKATLSKWMKTAAPSDLTRAQQKSTKQMKRRERTAKINH